MLPHCSRGALCSKEASLHLSLDKGMAEFVLEDQNFPVILNFTAFPHTQLIFETAA